MSVIQESPCPVRTLFREGGEGGIDDSGVGSTVAFHIGEGVGGNAANLLPFLQFVGGQAELITIGGVTTERIVPLRHPWFPEMVARAVRWQRTGRPIDTTPGATDWKVLVEFGTVPFLFGGDTPYMSMNRDYGASAITMPGQAYAVGGIPMNHDVAVVLPQIAYRMTKFHVPSMDDSVYKTLIGKVNAATFLGYDPQTVLFAGVQDEITTTIGFVTNRTVSLSVTWRPRSWNQILLPTGVWGTPVNINDGSNMYATGDFNLLLY